MNKKRKIFYLAWTEPSSNSGACLAMYRHFVIKQDFDAVFATDKNLQSLGDANYYINRNRLHKRLSRTRLRKIIAQYEMLVEPALIMRRCLAKAREYNPDAIFTIPDNTLSWAAYLLAKKLNKPLITNFQDWWPRGQFWSENERPYNRVRDVLERRFRRMYRESVVAFCTSDGMRRHLGEHPCAPVLYPCPAFREVTLPSINVKQDDSPLRIVYAGTIVRYYGQQVLKLAKALAGNQKFRFEIYGHMPDWPEQDLKWAQADGIYHGFLPYEQLKEKLRKADIFLVVMSHAPELRLMMETSFTTKFLDATQYAKPVIIWGPDYCAPVIAAKQYDIAVTVTHDDVKHVLQGITELTKETLYQHYSQAAYRAATTIFDPEKIHNIFVSAINNVL